MTERHTPRPLTARMPWSAERASARLGELLGDIPHLPGAACRGQHEVFDLEPDADPEAVERAKAACSGCPALEPCAEWVAATPPQRRPSGIVAGQLLPAPEPPPAPDTSTATGRAVVFLTERLHDGPRLVAELITEAATVGLNRGHLGEAAKRLDIARTRINHRQFSWALPRPA